MITDISQAWQGSDNSFRLSQIFLYIHLEYNVVATIFTNYIRNGVQKSESTTINILFVKITLLQTSVDIMNIVKKTYTI